MALINTYDYGGGWGAPVSEEDVNNYYAQLIPQPVDYGSINMDPYEFFTNTNAGPKDEFGNDLSVDAMEDWYFNNPDAQSQIQSYWDGTWGQAPRIDTAPTDIPPELEPDTEYPATQQPVVNYGPRGPYGTAYAPGANWPAFNMEGNLEKLAQQDRMQAGAWADLLEGGLAESQNRYENFEGMAREQAWNGMGGYADILAGRGGFSPEQEGNILQRDMLMGGMAGDADYAANFMTPEELSAIQGDPYAARDMAQGKLAYLDQWLREGDAAQRGAVSALDTELRATVDPAKLGLSDEYNANFQFGPEDAADYAQQAARMIGIRGQSERDALARAAASAGNVNPMAVAARQSRNKIQSDISAGDVYSDALLKGKGLQLDVAGQREAARLGTERDISGRQRQNVSETRQTQLDTERGISNAWNDYGRYNTNLMVDTTAQGEAAKSNRAGQLATNRQNVNQQNINTRFGQAGTASNALSGRYGQIYGQKKQEEAEGRGFLTGQQDRAQAGGQNAAGNRLNLYGQRMNAQGNATSRAIQAKNLPGMFDKAAGFFGGLFGG